MSDGPRRSPRAEVEWAEGGSVAIRCAVCSHAGEHDLIATATVDWQDDRVEVARCSHCGAIVMSAVQPPTDYFDEHLWDRYLESTAGLGAIAGLLVRAGRAADSSMLDVGCGYGFALDLGSFLFGWRGVGLDPSVAAARGRVDLGLDIRSGYLDTAFDSDEVFDVVFASEVLEHVPDPTAFLAALASRLSPDGVLLLTTPDAAVVHPGTDRTVLLATLSIGAHTFLVDEHGLERLLRDAGFEAHVWTDGPGLRVVAARSVDALARAVLGAELDYRDLAGYCDARADTAKPGSSLQVGMAARFLEYTVNLGDLERARSGVPRLRDALQRRYGADVDAPRAAIPLPACSVIVSVHYFLGILTLNGGGDPRDAAAHFEAAARAARALLASRGEYGDPAVPAFEFMALGHRAIALATASARRRTIDAALADVDDAVVRGIGDAVAASEFRDRTRQIRTQLKAASARRRPWRRLRTR